ncbi:phosphonate C-P lyase system protein PhnG [Rhizobiales bacterium]|uniref:phosphonate C-P lyase system protein PhnG n=1 Tax=Hongsoonwoonella zoysiae TaxID=2821844 RepID=UPI0015602CC1|nr:phosphonate C-P lyase system protein PhnG [Hongsoonwoonella zoysiae]NRG16953.1 phosphonate C-P lyase system protein PhnG [Hongsoonwoonella zoysiae]
MSEARDDDAAPKKMGDPRRKAVMALLARSDTERLANAWEALSNKPAFRTLRAPETGLVMMRGRAGGGGRPFNLGEATVTRAVVTIESGETGYSYALGRDRKKALYAALFDALWQTEKHRDEVERGLIAPLAEDLEAADATARAETAATKVDFFTMVRGED